jgi:hypothetical protein
MARGQTRSPKIQANIFKMIDANSITAGTAEDVWVPTGDRRVRLLGWQLSVSTICAVEFVAASADTTVLAQTPLLTATGIHTSPDLGDGILLGSNDDLQIDVTATATVSGMVWGVEEGTGY